MAPKPRQLIIFALKLLVMIKTGNPIISIYTEETPNPRTPAFVANKLLYPGKTADFPTTTATDHLWHNNPFVLPFVKSA